MNNEKQRIAIAEACGLPKPYSRWSGADSDTLCHSVTVEDGLKRAKPIPDYTQDLNAMHEAEQVLSRGAGYHQTGGFGLYKTALAEVCDEQHPIDATASQRAEAFLRTLGKWSIDHP